MRDAWDAIERVEALAPRCPDPQLATASTLYAKAWVAAQRDEARWDDALAWLDVATRTFARRDTAKVNDVLWLRAAVFFRRRDYSSALQLFELLWQRLQSTELAIAIGGCAVKCGDAERAAEMYAYVEKRELTPLLATQIVCLRGELSLLRGEYAEGLQDLAASAAAYRDLGMADTAIHTDLLRVRAMMEEAPDNAAANPMKQLLAAVLFIIVLAADPGYAAVTAEHPQPAVSVEDVVRGSIDRFAKKIKRTIRRVIGSQDDYPNPPWPRP